ncbi:phage replisome organizer protein [Lactococcus lactis]
MARPKKQTVDYFPHYVNSGKTLFILEKRYENNGYAFWFKVLELLGSTNGHIIDSRNPDEWEFLLAKTLVSDSLAREMLDLLAKLNAIDLELWNVGIIWGTNFVENVADVYKNRKVGMPKKPDVNSFYEQKPEQAIVSTSRNPEPSEFSTQPTNINSQSKVKESKVKESKVNQSKVKESKTNNQEIFSRFFELFSNFNKKNISKRAMALQVFLDLPQFQKDCIVKGAENYIQDYLNNHSDDPNGNYSVNPYEFLDNVMFMNYQEEVKEDTGYDEDLGF